MLGQFVALQLLLLYIAINLIYCMGAKNIALLDVFLLSSGYVIRVVLGCALLGVLPSNWLLLCSSALALFLSLTKRRADLVGGVDETHRPSLAGYNTEFLNQAMGLMGGLSILAYSLYCMEASALVEGREFASLPFVVFGVLDYMRVAYVRGEGGAPVELLFRSPVLFVCAAGWFVSIVFSTGVI
jgi:4-hydroxybenzoate polyprenyltransferase